MSKTVVGLFDTQDHAELAARQIKDQGLRTSDISIVAKSADTGDPYDKASMGGDTGYGGGNEEGNVDNTIAVMGDRIGGNASGGRTGPNASIVTNSEANNEMGRRLGGNDNISDGVISGGLLGGIAGLLIGAGSMIIPGLGIIAAAGPITGLLSGAVTGGIVGGLIDLGIPESESRQYESGIRQGKVLFSMKTDDDKVDRVASILRNSGAGNVEVY
jgi:uncharacterized membrane protein